jgi:predicted nuclease of predicted toxin-antitoxin system
MKFLVDMNLSPRWCSVLSAEGWDSVHWSNVGVATAPDHEVMQWALAEQRVVLTHDLDFGAMLAATRATGPSVVQVRTQDVRPQILAPILVSLLRQYEQDLDAGALLVVDEAKSRVRVLPLPGKAGP